MTLPYQCREVKIVAGHPALILNEEATLSSNYAAKANAGVTDFLKEAARRARGDVFASIVCPLITRRAAPTEHIRRTSLFLESYIIPKMLMNGINIGKNTEKAIKITRFSHGFILSSCKNLFQNHLMRRDNPFLITTRERDSYGMTKK